MKLGIDVDGCIYDWHLDLQQWVEHTTGEKYPKPKTWNFSEEWGMTREEFNQYWYQGVVAGKIFCSQPAPEEALEVLDRLHSKGHELYIITSRLLPGIEEHCIRNTEKWISEWNVPHTELHIVGHGKADICNRLEIDLMIDDAIHNYKDLSETDTLPVMFTQPWNEHYDADVRVDSWYEFEEVVDWFDYKGE